MTALPVAVAGASGRMGSAVVRALEGSPEFSLVARPGRGTIEGNWSGARALADFTSPEATIRIAGLAAERGVALVVGTTGLDDAAEEAIDRAASRVAVVVAPNLSLGVAAVKRGLRAILPALPGYDVEIVEQHHRAKLDAPSGTALDLARTAADLRGLPFPGSVRAGRVGRTGPRPADEIGVHAVRGGSWVGEHVIHLAGPSETVTLGHVAQDRDCFAQGALHALRFVAGARPGRYALEDTLVG